MTRLAVSNIAWEAGVESVLNVVADAGATGVEVAPAQVAAWDVLDNRIMAEYRTLCENLGLSIVSFQGFMFGWPDLQLLDEPGAFQKFEEHMRRVSELAATAGAKVLVFGAPKNRLALGHDAKTAEQLTSERLLRLAEIAWEHETSIGLEAVPEYYGAETVTSYKDSLRIVRAVSHPGLVFHLDTGCTWLAGDSIAEAIHEARNDIRHFHISQPDLATFDPPADYHAAAVEALSDIDYSSWLCIEMKRTDTPAQSVQEAIAAVRSTYRL